MAQEYIHGYDEVEQQRLRTQNAILAQYIYDRCPFGRDLQTYSVL